MHQVGSSFLTKGCIKRIPFPFHGNHSAYTKYVRLQLGELQRAGSLTLTEIHKLQNHLKQEIRNAWRVHKQGGDNLNDYFRSIGMTLDYYEMVEPWEPELVGVKDGSSQATVIEKGFKNKQHYKKKIMDVFPNPNHFNSDEAMTTEFELECVKQKKDAILTDFLSFRAYELSVGE